MKGVDVFRGLKQYQPNITMTQTQQILNKIDHAAIFKKHRARYRSQVWDEKSSINGIEPEQILARHDIPKNPSRKILLIYVDGRLSRIQPHDPDESGFVPLTAADCEESNPNSKVSRHLDELAQREADVELMETAISQI